MPVLSKLSNNSQDVAVLHAQIAALEAQCNQLQNEVTWRALGGGQRKILNYCLHLHLCILSASSAIACLFFVRSASAACCLLGQHHHARLPAQTQASDAVHGPFCTRMGNAVRQAGGKDGFRPDSRGMRLTSQPACYCQPTHLYMHHAGGSVL